ncbi:MAG: PQQ-binding-like beta-propeller repeat protein [Victivallales bacterium]|nr:PQQ-binding-like beta-propeller repeat protein [Victivallales bacterium]
MKMKIVILTQYYPPEHGAPQNRLHDLAIRAAKAGHDTIVLTAMPNYPLGKVFPEYKGQFFTSENIDGVKVLRSWIFASRRKGLLPQLTVYFSFVLSSLIAGLIKLPRADFLICESPPLFLGLTAMALKTMKRARMVMNISDLWPESAVQLGIIGPGIKLSLLQHLERILYSESAIVSCQTEGIQQGVLDSCPAARTLLYPNGVDLKMFPPARKSAQFTKKFRVGTDNFVVGYGGNHGRSQALSQVLLAAEIVHKKNPNVLFLLFGDGPEKDELVKKAGEMKLQNLRFMPPQKRQEMAKVQGLWDIALVPLKDIALFNGARPSKMFELMAGKIPFIFCGSGEGADIARKSGCSLPVPPENPGKLASKILEMAEFPPEKLKEMGSKGRKFVQRYFNRAKLAESLLHKLTEIIQGESGTNDEARGKQKKNGRSGFAMVWALNSIAVACAIIAIAIWQGSASNINVSRNIPGMDFPNSGRSSQEAKETAIGEFFEAYMDIPQDSSPYSWPRFRGPDFDNISRQSLPLQIQAHDQAPHVAWQIQLGEGHAAPVVHHGKVYILDYDEQNKADALRCLSLKNGKEIWRRWYRNPLKRNHGISRTIPAVNNDYVLTVGPAGHVMCLRADSGELLWSVDMVREYGTAVPLWYTGQCPLIDGDIAVIAPAGDTVLMAGILCETGETVWQTENTLDLKMSHSSIIPMTLAGKRTFVYSALGAIVGVSAESSDHGKMLWACDEWNRKVVAPSPVFLGDDRLLITAGYGGGSMILRISQDNSGFAYEVLQAVKPAKGLASEQQTPIVTGNRIYSIMPKDAGVLRQQFVCASPDNITEILWASGPENRFGLGPFILADNKFFIMDDNGYMTVLDMTSSHPVQIARFKALDGHDAWGPIAIAGDKMLVRDSTTMRCLDFAPRLPDRGFP